MDWQRTEVSYISRRRVPARVWSQIPVDEDEQVIGQIVPSDELAHERRAGQFVEIIWSLRCSRCVLAVQPPTPTNPNWWFHSQPTSDVYSDTPTFADIFFAIKKRAFISIGRKWLSLISCTQACSKRLLSRIAEWEHQFQYNVNRKRADTKSAKPIEHRYAWAALRALGMCWPSRQSVRQKQWPQHVEALGLKVERHRRRDLNLQMEEMEERATKWKARKWRRRPGYAEGRAARRRTRP